MANAFENMVEGTESLLKSVVTPLKPDVKANKVADETEDKAMGVLEGV